MDSNKLRIFSYLPNPRIFKSTIVGRICGVEIEIRGDKPNELSEWLWDFDAKPLKEAENSRLKEKTTRGTKGFSNRLFKTKEFLRAHPYGSVPAAFSPDGEIGIFESNSIMRSVARIGKNTDSIYGSNPFSSSRIDSFLDASLIFARDSQIYLLSLMKNTLTNEIYNSTKVALSEWLNGIEGALSSNKFISSGYLSLADVCFVCEMALLANEQLYDPLLTERKLEFLLHEKLYDQFPKSWKHFNLLCEHSAFKPDLQPYLSKLNTKREMSNVTKRQS
ncbi:MAG: glutathione S-transferase [Pseudomonadota bacterium]|nr:glutathione S-transferase [Pseudomonadota bacterium]